MDPSGAVSDDTSGRAVGIIGLGLMGLPMAGRLLEAGYRVTGHNRSRSAQTRLEDMGGLGAQSPKQVAAKTSVIVLMLTDSPAVERVVRGPDGLLDGLQPGSIVIDMGTTAVSLTRDLGSCLAKQGGHWVDAPVSGGTKGAETGTLSIMVGGDETAIAAVRPILAVLGQTITLMGGPGLGQATKAANQVIVGLSIGAVSEAMVLGRAAGVPLEPLRNALMAGFAASKVLDAHGMRMINDHFTPGGRATVQRKDMDQALALAEQLGISLPATALNRDLYDRLIADGFGDLDHAALIKAIDPNGWPPYSSDRTSGDSEPPDPA